MVAVVITTVAVTVAAGVAVAVAAAVGCATTMMDGWRSRAPLPRLAASTPALTNPGTESVSTRLPGQSGSLVVS